MGCFLCHKENRRPKSRQTRAPRPWIGTVLESHKTLWCVCIDRLFPPCFAVLCLLFPWQRPTPERSYLASLSFSYSLVASPFVIHIRILYSLSFCLAHETPVFHFQHKYSSSIAQISLFISAFLLVRWLPSLNLIYT